VLVAAKVPSLVNSGEGASPNIIVTELTVPMVSVSKRYPRQDGSDLIRKAFEEKLRYEWPDEVETLYKSTDRW
jgi:hypothetical protein